MRTDFGHKNKRLLTIFGDIVFIRRTFSNYRPIRDDQPILEGIVILFVIESDVIQTALEHFVIQ